MTDVASRGQLLRDLHAADELLTVLNVWDVASARVVAALPGTRALATAGHSIAATFGYEDGGMTLDLMLDMVGRIAADTDLPVSADLEAGFGDPGETIRRAIGVGVVGANLEDRMEPFDRSVAAVRAAVQAAEAEGVPFALNARTDAIARGVDDAVQEAVRRGKAFLEEGATSVFVPGNLDEPTVQALVEGLGRGRLSVIRVPGSLPTSRLQELGVTRVSYGPWTQRVALHAVQQLGTAILEQDGSVPEDTPALN
jgi:2-methylisocitrate lyase-like PEP mutase family enzyme